MYLQTASNIEIHVLPEELHLQHNAIYFAVEQQQPGLGVGTRNSTMQLKQEFHRNAEKLQKIWECGPRDAAVAAWRCHLSK